MLQYVLRWSKQSIVPALVWLASGTTLVAGAPHVYGSWDVMDIEPDPGRRVASITLLDDLRSMKLVCSSGQWALYIDRTSPSDDKVHPFADFEWHYSLNGGAPEALPGEGQRGHSFQTMRANALVRSLFRSDGRLLFDLGRPGTWYAASIRGTREAISPFLSRCPLDE